MDSVGKRLRGERMRLGLSQPEFAALGGLKHKTQLNYEADVSAPDARYLLALREVGVDIWYVLTGEVSPAVLPADEGDLIDGYRQLNEAGKAAVQGFIATCINTGSMTSGGEGASAPRVKRLAENRRAALDQRMAENVERAMAEVERLKAERAGKTRK
ncbi:helix-turn-helix domain-containing protein [Burkholderia gladioli]|uniref:helix-turn-helix domain-containing protein n=1 Tax=Burkholderia gladioli TaxID=28095 RepID=UPI000F8071BB|nr:transcriptional regulator [Burkholderia gladioli]